MTFDSTDFLASSRADLKYAEAYTLVHFLLHAENGRRRPGFIAFLKSAFKGQASQTHFKDAIGGTDAEIERAWRAYVKMISG